MVRVRITTLFLPVALCALLAPASVSATLLPLSSIDDSYFPSEADDVQIVSVDLDVTRWLEAEALTGEALWRVDAQYVLRNHDFESQAVEFAVLDHEAWSDWTEVFIDGIAVIPTAIEPSYDPAHPELLFEHGQRVQHTFVSQELVTVRTVTYVAPQVDDLGQVFVSVPTHVLGLWDEAIPTALISMDLYERPIGLQTSLSGYTRYDEPHNLLTWFVLDWNPTRALEVAYLPAWSALLLVSTVEACPEPWSVIQHMTNGDMGALMDYLGAYDQGSLEFCSALPLMIHGYVFDSDRAREQFGQIPVSRYLGSDSDRGSIYVENPAFEMDMLTDVEAIYRRTLLSAVQ